MMTKRTLATALLMAATAQGAINVFEREALPGPAPGTCQVITEGNAQLTLCVKSVKVNGDDSSVVEGLFYNSGSVPLCAVKVEGRGAGEIKNIWPDWATTEESDMAFTPGQVSNTGMLIGGQAAEVAAPAKPALGAKALEKVTAPATPAVVEAPATTPADATTAAPVKKVHTKKAPKADAEAVAPAVVQAPKIIKKNPLYATGPATIGVVSFKACDGTAALDEKTSRVKTVKLEDIKLPEPAPEQQQQQQPAQPQQVEGNKLIEIVEDPIEEGPAAATCHYYKEGKAELIMCVRKVEPAGDDVKLIDGFFYNNGTVPLCNIMIEASGAKAGAANVWPDWATGKGKEELIFQAGQVSDAGATITGNSANPSLLVTGFKACDSMDALKKDTPAYTIPLADVKVPVKPKAQAAPVAPKKAATADAEVAAPAEVEVPATEEVVAPAPKLVKKAPLAPKKAAPVTTPAKTLRA